MSGKSGRELANLTTLQARMLLKAAGAYADAAAHHLRDYELDPTDRWCLDQAIAKLEAALGERESMLPAK